jgi:hypothetical protein
VHPNELESYAARTSQRARARQSVVFGRIGWGLVVGLTIPPRKNSTVTKPPEPIEDVKTQTGL